VGNVKPFPSSSVGLAEVKHSFTAQSNPPCPASASPSHLLEGTLKAVALLKFQALHAVLSERSPQLAFPTTRFLSTMPAGTEYCLYNQPLWVAIFGGPQRSFQEGSGVALGLACGVAGASCKAVSTSRTEQQRGLFEGKRLFRGRGGSHAALQLCASHAS